MNTNDTLQHLSWTASCPLCGQPNQCAVALGQLPQSCWCMSTPVSLLALALLPEQERGQRCVCPTCAQGQKSLPS